MLPTKPSTRLCTGRSTFLVALAACSLAGCPQDQPDPPAASAPRTVPGSRPDNLESSSSGRSPSSQPVEPPKAPPNVILITVDTLRADHLGCYGYELATSPRIDRFAAGATLYTRAMATAPWTVPTHASLFTGRYPFEHGAHTFKVSKPGNNVNPLPLEHLTLAEVLKSEGYVTGAFAANTGYLSTRWQLDQGFETYHVERSYAETLNRRVFEWLAAQGDRDFFLFINYIDTHAPYNTAPRPGLLERPVVQRSHLLRVFKERILSGTEPIPHAVIQQVIDQYDTAVANVDEEIGALLDMLVAADLYDNTMIVLTSDHGEYFGEHRLVGHSKDVYQEVLWVPLIVKRPGQRRGEVSDTLISSTDVPNLICRQLPRAVRDRCTALFPDAPGNHAVVSENYFTRPKDLFNKPWAHRFRRVRTAVYEWPYKYIHSSDGENELYHLELDPAESNNLIDQRIEVATRLADKLRDFQSRRRRWEGAVDTSPLTEEEREQLEALGYLGD